MFKGREKPDEFGRQRALETQGFAGARMGEAEERRMQRLRPSACSAAFAGVPRRAALVLKAFP